MEKVTWWNCNHEGKGVKGCPLCDKTLTPDVIEYLRAARVEIGKLKACEEELLSIREADWPCS